MSKHTKYVPKHRHAAEPTLREAPKKALRTGVVMTSVAVAVTGIAVSGGVLGGSSGTGGDDRRRTSATDRHATASPTPPPPTAIDRTGRRPARPTGAARPTRPR